MLLGVDIGTTGTKTILVSDDGKLIHSSYQGYELIKPHPSYVEQNPEDWWNAFVNTVKDCVSHADAKQSIKAMCLSVQSGTMVPVDKNIKPTANAISWLDSRAMDDYEELVTEKGEDFFYRKTGWRLSGYFNFLQIYHMNKHNPEVFDKTDYFLTVADYFAYRLTGHLITDENSIGNSQLSNVETGTWDKDILEIAGIDLTKVATVIGCSEIVGNLRRDAAELLDLSTDVKLVTGAQDQYCSTISIGACNTGDVMFSTGTSWVLLGVSDKIVYDTKNYLTLGRHIVPNLFSSFAYTPAGGAALKWYRDNVARTIGFESESYDQITANAGAIALGSDGLFFLPHFGGTLFPTWSTQSRGVLWGLDFVHTRDHIARAIMEGVAYEMTWMIMEMQNAGYDTKKLKCLGGSTRSNVWMQIVSDMTNLEMDVSDFADMAPMGAAMMAGVGIGIYKNYQEAYDGFNMNTRKFIPNNSNHKVYRELFEQYKELFSMQQKTFKL